MIKNIDALIKNNNGVLNSAKKFIQLYKKLGLKESINRVYLLSTNKNNIDIIQSKIFYKNWINKYNHFLNRQPANKSLCFSIVVPVYNANLLWLDEAINSVINQSYSNWELCIADDCSTDPQVKVALKAYASNNPKIKVTFREANGHISAASNSAIDLASGDWIVLLDQDDLLHLDALANVADTIERNPSCQMIYSDEDKIDENGNRFNPYFKSDWNLDLFLSHNMFSHLGCYKTSLIKEVGGFRIGFEGAQDYDLALRCIERITHSDIQHIPHVLYHWRVHSASTASGAAAKPYAMIAGERAINDHLGRLNVNAYARLINHGYRVRYALPNNDPLVSIIIPTHNKSDLLENCITSILDKTNYKNYELIIVDNNSNDASTLQYLKWVTNNPRIKVLKDPGEFNYSRINNKAVQEARGDFIALVNNDIEVISPDWLTEMLSHAARVGVGAVGAKLWYPNSTIQHAGLILGVGGVANSAHHLFARGQQDYFSKSNLLQSVSAVTAACLLVKKEAYLQVGGLDEENLGVAFNDVDFCLRLLEHGYKNIFTPYAELFHHESASRGYDVSKEKQDRLAREDAYMWKRWGAILKNDPAYNPNLSNEKMDFSLAFPPRH